ncbi:MAG: polysaccharide biosynthesis/export family protein [Alphaproteobacteria bacterium]
MKIMHFNGRIGKYKRVALMLSGIVLLSSCANYSSVSKLRTPKILAPSQYPEYIIQPGDTLDVKFFYSPDLNDNITVRPDGKISLQLVDDVQAAGLTVQELDDSLTRKYNRVIADGADVSVIVKDFSSQRLYITGEVTRPGEYPLRYRQTILQAVAAAGGFLDTAKRDAVLVIRQQNDDPPEVFLAELQDGDLVKSGDKAAYHLLYPRDIIVVPKSNVAKVDLFMDQYVRDILRFNGFSAGVSGVYELNNKDRLGDSN